MRLVTLDQKQLNRYTIDPEMLQKAKRPCALIVKLTYKGTRYDFAIPLRSNISPSTPKEQYFPLPPRRTTRTGCRHGVHYIKMFPVDRTKVLKFNTDSRYYSMIKSLLDGNEKAIISACQEYLEEYEKGVRPRFCTDIDLLIENCL